MKKSLFLLSAFALIVVAAAFSTSAQSLSPSTKWHWKQGTIVIDTPQRQPGQQHALGLTVPKIPVVRVAFVGLGMRGPDAVRRFSYLPGIQVMALCDHEQKNADKCLDILKSAGLPPADTYSGATGYEDLCKRTDIDLVYIATDWDHHFPVAKCALENGHHVAIEVPSCMNLEQCWELIDLSETKRLHCMILENCCYDWFELNTLNMAQKGLFGEVLRVQGAYIHTLYEFWPHYWKNGPSDKLGWRLRYNMENRGDVYATHGLGPVAQVLNIHRGDQMTRLVAMDTKSVIGKELVEGATGEPCKEFRNGDHTTTLIQTAQGKVIEIQHCVMAPQPYNRLYQVTGTRGFANKYPNEGYAISKEAAASSQIPDVDNLSTHSYVSEEQKEALVKQYMSPLLTEYGELAKEVGGHGGMDFIMDARLVYCLQNGLPLDMDVYDLAEWCSLAELGAISMDNGNAAVAFPDFTRGHCFDVKGFKHAYASDADAAEARKVAKEATAKLKADAPKAWVAYEKAQAKKAKEKAKAEAKAAKKSK